jgi:hypothetical protein
MTDLTPSEKKLAPLKLAHGMRLRNGQIISDGSAPIGAAKRPTPIEAGPTMRSRVEGHGVITPIGPEKVRGPAPIGPGQRSRNSDPSAC